MLRSSVSLSFLGEDFSFVHLGPHANPLQAVVRCVARMTVFKAGCSHCEITHLPNLRPCWVKGVDC